MVRVSDRYLESHNYVYTGVQLSYMSARVHDRLYFALQKCRSSFKICPPYHPYEGIIYDAYLQELNGVMLIAVIFVSGQLLLASVILILQCLSGMLQESIMHGEKA